MLACCERPRIDYRVETLILTGKMENTWKRCDQRMHRHKAEVTWNDRLSSEKIANRCGLKGLRK